MTKNKHRKGLREAARPNSPKNHSNVDAKTGGKEEEVTEYKKWLHEMMYGTGRFFTAEGSNKSVNQAEYVDEDALPIISNHRPT